MVKNDSFQPIGKRLDNLNKKLKTDHPEDMWVMKDILNAFLLIIESSSSLEQQHIVSKELNRLFDTYEFRYNTILENKKIMTQETLRMQMLAGVITESEYKAIINKEIEDAEKASLNESMIGGIVGIGAINQIPPRAKADYETAFEHFLGGKYGLNEVEMEEGNLGHGENYSIEPEGRFWIVTYKTVEGVKEKVFQSEEEAEDFVKFGINMEEGKEGKEGNEVEEKTYFPQGEFKSTENFEDFLKEIDAMPKESVKQIMGKHHYIPTPGTYQQQAKNYDNDIKLYMEDNIGKTDLYQLEEYWKFYISDEYRKK